MSVTEQQDLPKFSQFNPDNFQQQLQALLKDNQHSIDQLTQQATFNWQNLMQPLEDMDDQLSQLWSPLSHLNSVMNSSQLRDVYNACLPLLSQYQTDLGQNESLFKAIESISKDKIFNELEQAQKKIIENELRDFKLSGIDLDEEKKAHFKQLAQELTQLTAKFEQNLLDATQAWTKHITDITVLDGLPETSIAAAKQAAEQRQLDGYLLTLEMPCYFAVITYANSRELREEIYQAYNTRASDQGPQAKQFDNTSVMHDILLKRLEIAKLLGFNNYAERSIATKMVHSTQQVLDFLEQLVKASLPKAKEEFARLQQFAAEELNLTQLQAWDVSYASEKLRLARHDVSQEALRAYFPENKVVEGLFNIVSRLFKVNIKQINDADVWHQDVKCYALYDTADQIKSIVYFDLYARENKRGGAWMDEYRVRRKTRENEIQTPIAYVTCNFNSPIGDTPALLKHDEVVTLFHEFGHALQHMLTQIDYMGVSGINGVPWDAVELASQFLENWAWQEESLPLISGHYETHEPLPKTLFEKMQGAKNFQSALMMMRQLEFALFDFKLHLNFDPSQEQQVQQILDEVRREVTVVPVPAFNRFQHGFAHIFAGGYAAGYYSYKWAEVMAEDAFSLFLEKGIFDEETSQLFHDTILSCGGAEEPLDLFVKFRGHEPQVEALLKASGIT